MTDIQRQTRTGKEPLKKTIKLLLLDVDGTLTDGGIYITEEGTQFKKYNAKDGLGIMLAARQGVEVGIISHSSAVEMVRKRAEMLQMKFCYVGKEPKSSVLDKWCRENNWDKKEVAFIGDDLNDLDIMQQVGFTACPADAVETVKEQVQTVLEKRGGHGCVREFIDRFILT